jgi:membrane protein YqaA with SNARE-associated domain
MRIFSWFYNKALRWAAHPHAPRYLGALSFAEASFFPVPPDVMLAPMVMARREQAWRYAALATVASVLGGLLGYAIGVFLYQEVALPIIELYHAGARFERVQEWFRDYGFWVVFLAGFTPIPYKVFTITAGVTGMAVLPFLIASTVGRGARFFLVAGLLFWGGHRVESVIESRLDHIGWITVTVAIIAYIVYRGLS